jgi:hypothetical protein
VVGPHGVTADGPSDKPMPVVVYSRREAR